MQGLAIVGAVLVIVGLVLFAPLLGALVGCITGWIVGLFFGDTILGILAQIGIEKVSMWEVGCFLGFVGGFFKSSSSSSSKD